MDVMARFKSRFDRVGDRGELRWYTTRWGVIELEKDDKKRKF